MLKLCLLWPLITLWGWFLWPCDPYTDLHRCAGDRANWYFFQLDIMEGHVGRRSRYWLNAFIRLPVGKSVMHFLDCGWCERVPPTESDVIPGPVVLGGIRNQNGWAFSIQPSCWNLYPASPQPAGSRDDVCGTLPPKAMQMSEVCAAAWNHINIPRLCCCWEPYGC